MDITIESLEAAITNLEHELRNAERPGPSPTCDLEAELMQRIANMDALIARLYASRVCFEATPAMEHPNA